MTQVQQETEFPNSKSIKKIGFQSSIKNLRIFLVLNLSFKVSVFSLPIVDFRLWINEALIRDDIDNLRSLLRRPATEEEPKKAKKIKQD